MELELSGKRALVTGAHRGTGSIIARRLAEEGAQVIVHGHELAPAQAVAEQLPGAVAVAGDLLSDSGAEALWQDLQRDGGLDILVNNYGTSARGSFTASSSEDWQDMYNHNVLSAARLIRRVLPDLRARGWGRIINLGTAGTQHPGARNPHYYAAKGALDTLTQSLADEVAGSGITANLVAPGIIRTEEVETWIRALAERHGWGTDWPTMEARFLAERFPTAVGRLAERSEIADLVCFLASPRSGYLHGQILRIAGG